MVQKKIEHISERKRKEERKKSIKREGKNQKFTRSEDKWVCGGNVFICYLLSSASFLFFFIRMEVKCILVMCMLIVSFLKMRGRVRFYGVCFTEQNTIIGTMIYLLLLEGWKRVFRKLNYEAKFYSYKRSHDLGNIACENVWIYQLLYLRNTGSKSSHFSLIPRPQ